MTKKYGVASSFRADASPFFYIRFVVIMQGAYIPSSRAITTC